MLFAGATLSLQNEAIVSGGNDATLDVPPKSPGHSYPPVPVLVTGLVWLYVSPSHFLSTRHSTGKPQTEEACIAKRQPA